MYYDGSTESDTAGNKAHFPRLSSSIIETLTIFVNGTQIENIQNYHLLYNSLYDLDGGGIDQQAKDILKMLTRLFIILLVPTPPQLELHKLLFLPQQQTQEQIMQPTIASSSSIRGWVS